MARLRQYARGAEALIEFLGDECQPVPQSQAYARSRICENCPLNRRPKTLPARALRSVQRLAHRYTRIKKRMGLSVPNEHALGLCDACECLVALKVHIPLYHILRYTDNDTMERFHPDCWVINE